MSTLINKEIQRKNVVTIVSYASYQRAPPISQSPGNKSQTILISTCGAARRTPRPVPIAEKVVKSINLKTEKKIQQQQRQNRSIFINTCINWEESDTTKKQNPTNIFHITAFASAFNVPCLPVEDETDEQKTRRNDWLWKKKVNVQPAACSMKIET